MRSDLLAGAAVVLGALGGLGGTAVVAAPALLPGVDADLARSGYVERSTTVVATSAVEGETPTVTTADGLTVGALSPACPGAPTSPSVGDRVTVATLPSVDGSVRLDLLGPCDPELTASRVGFDLGDDGVRVGRPYRESPGDELVGPALAVVLVGTGGALALGAVAVVARRSEGRAEAATAGGR